MTTPKPRSERLGSKLLAIDNAFSAAQLRLIHKQDVKPAVFDVIWQCELGLRDELLANLRSDQRPEVMLALADYDWLSSRGGTMGVQP